MRFIHTIWIVPLALLAVFGSAAPAVVAPKADATLDTFAGRWIGHTRSLKISRRGIAREHVNSGCCVSVIDLRLRLRHPRGTEENARIKARVIDVEVHEPEFFTDDDPAPKVGDKGTLRLKRGVIKEPFIGTNYCDEEAVVSGACGA